MLKVTKNINFKAALAGAALLTILSTLVPNIAEARGSGGKGSGGKTDDFDVNYEFDLFTLEPSLKPRTPNAGGTFVGAIENFKGSFYDVDDKFLLDIINITDKFAEPGEPTQQLNPLAFLDLSPRSILAGETIKLLNGNEALSSSDEDGNGLLDDKITASKNRLEYTLTGNDLSKYGISELTLFIEDLSQFDLLNTPAEQNQALTSIDYIVNNKLLGLVNGIRVSGSSKADSSVIVSSEATDETPQDDEGDVRNIDFNPISTTVPESSNVLGLLVLGGLGTSLLLRKKPEQA